MLRGITLCWARKWTRSINRSLLCLLSIIFDCWEENFAREKPKLPSTPRFSFRKRPDYITLQAHVWRLKLGLLQPLSLSHQFCFAHPLSPLLLRSTGKNFLERRIKKKGEKGIWISLISDLFRLLYNIHLFWAVFDASFPPTPVTNQLWVASSCPFFSSLKVRITIPFLSRARWHHTRASSWAGARVSSTPAETHTFCLRRAGWKATRWSRTQTCQPLGKRRGWSR